MPLRSIPLTGLLVALSSLALASSPYAFTTISDPAADPPSSTIALGINDAGQIVGTYGGSGGPLGFLYSNGVFTTISYPGAAGGTVATGINNAGEIVGYYGPSSGGTAGFLYSGGTFTTINEPLATLTTGTYPRGINDAGEIVGSYGDTSCNCSQGFLYSGGTFATINYPSASGGPSTTAAAGINDAGVIVGSYSPAMSGSAGFVDTAGTLVTIDAAALGYEGLYGNLFAYGISNAGVIVGYYSPGAGETPCTEGNCGFLDDGGAFATIMAPSSAFTNAYGANSAGQIVGQTDSGSFLATPSATPTISSVAPGLGLKAKESVKVTIRGTNFFAGWTTVQSSGSGVSPSAVSVSNSTELTVTLTIASGARLGVVNLTCISHRAS